MALVTLTELKAYLRVTHTLEDTLITAMLATAKGIIEDALGVPLASATRAWTDRAFSPRTDYRPPSLLLPYPCKLAGLVVTDGDGVAVAATEYDTSELLTTGILWAARGCSWWNGPYSGTATIGLSEHPDYTTRVEPIVNAVIQDIVADLYQRRNPGATAEADPGVSTTYSVEQLPPRTRRMLASLAPIVG